MDRWGRLLRKRNQLLGQHNRSQGELEILHTSPLLRPHWVTSEARHIFSHSASVGTVPYGAQYLPALPACCTNTKVPYGGASESTAQMLHVSLRVTAAAAVGEQRGAF